MRRCLRCPTVAAHTRTALLACAVSVASVASLGACAPWRGSVATDAPRAAPPAERDGAGAAGTRRGGSPATPPGSDVDPTLNGVSM